MRTLDIAFAITLLMLTLPVLAAIALAIRATSPGPVIFRQTRGGKDGIPFTCLKFRTMIHNAEDVLQRSEELRAAYTSSRKIAGDPRVTQIGRILRRTSLDELPQVWNILIGQMSVVGPRPVTLSELTECYGQAADRVFSVRPGLTGLWQVSGRSSLSYENRIALDLDYVRRRNLALDVLVLMKTLPAVLRRRGAL